MARSPYRTNAPTRGRHASRLERERRIRQAAILGTSAVLILAALLLGWGMYDQYVRTPNKPVATVGDVPITLSDYQRLVQYKRWELDNYTARLEQQKQQFAAGGDDQAFLVQYVDQQLQQSLSQRISLPTTVLEQLIDDQLIRQEADARGISVSDDEIEQRLEEQFGYERNPPTPVPTPITATTPITLTPAPTPTTMSHDEYARRSDEWFKVAQEATGFTAQDFRLLLSAELYREKMRDALGSEAPSSAEKAQARHILVETREEADAVLMRLSEGESFEDLAMELSSDESNKDVGGDLGWFGRGRMVPEFETAAFALQPGQVSGPIETQFGFHIIRLDDYDPESPLDEEGLAMALSEFFEEWLSDRRASPGVSRSFDSTMIPTPIPTRVVRRR